MLKGKTKRGVDIRETYGMPSRKLPPLCIVVLDRSRARIFKKPDREPIEAMHEIPNPEGRAQIHELVTDRAGRSFDSHTEARGGQSGPPRHAMSTENDPVEQIAMNLTKRVARYLQNAHVDNEFGRLLIVTEPQLLGNLRQNLKPEVSRCVVGEVTRDLAWLSGNALIQRLQPLTDNLPRLTTQ